MTTTIGNLQGAQRVLLVEDEMELARVTITYLREHGYVVRHADNGEDALRLLALDTFQIVLLDVMLPGLSGLEVAKRLRTSERNANVPIIMLTARNAESDLIEGLESGADDYMTKPFSPRELEARIQAMLRRVHDRKPGTKVLTWSEGGKERIKLDRAMRTALLDGVPVALAPKEFDLLWALIEAEGTVLSREDLLLGVWGYTYAGDTRTVDVHVRQLRKKLGNACPIKTVWGAGYSSRQEPS